MDNTIPKCSVLCFIIWMIIGFCCYFAGYIPYTHKNKVLEPVVATVISHNNVLLSCPYDCNCQTDCHGGSMSCCDTCYEKCWNHFATFRYTPDPEFVYDAYPTTSEKFIKKDLHPLLIDPRYAVGANLTIYFNICYYNPIDESDKKYCDTLNYHVAMEIHLWAARSILSASIASFIIVFFSVIIIIFYFFMRRHEYTLVK